MRSHWIVAGIAALAMVAGAQASIIFDDFNTNEGHFNQAPNYSGTSTIDATSTADRVTGAGEMIEGTGGEKLVLVKKAVATPQRCRFLSGLGTPANNVSFPITSGTDGFIGFYYKIAGDLANAAGVTLLINLDETANTGALMDSGKAKTVIADGAWHLAEWDLDNAADWGATPGIGGDGVLTPGTTRTIDSIYITNLTFPNSPVTIYIDFVAKSDSGSIANMIPEPATMGFLALGAAMFIRRRRA